MNKGKCDLSIRTFQFSIEVIHFCQSLPYNHITSILIKQLIRAATSIGANYQEALAACSRNDFANKVSISRKEAFEVEYWLQLLKQSSLVKDDTITPLLHEINELKLIFSKSSHTLSKR